MTKKTLEELQQLVSAAKPGFEVVETTPETEIRADFIAHQTERKPKYNATGVNPLVKAASEEPQKTLLVKVSSRTNPEELRTLIFDEETGALIGEQG
ncbi:hypothetical protein [Deinococcus cellulosilyticus]|uniref:Uncharacterized protein n=1 Tax=Deinococcus cellulosilyticus (strain DSM 18568 / NBRC 106333 / KACC 11606 / 5516J-15) TaxID=1223518 RepID=A0A511N1Q2_DEIC1|nr:hypothetical protein [Deinococcus cellulosilyticus]GEM46276.1 hypothetical protein DC3_19110 [Deinococcus cellulosilyticus NBRC 106333 = KACC 11606]